MTKCYCRHEAWHLGKNCSAPIDDICMTLGDASDFVVEQGFARRASVEELRDTLKKAEDFGLVHLGDNVLDQTTFLCNCCGCCCGFLQGITQQHLKHAVTTTQFIAKPNFDECNGCEECKDRCQIQAIRVEGDYPVVYEAPHALGRTRLVRARDCVRRGRPDTHGPDWTALNPRRSAGAPAAATLAA